ncbi:MAG: STAS domain-containing protein [Rhodoferax sp.]|nr:STAS domain-containing protein [Rhodoferax sp.]
MLVLPQILTQTTARACLDNLSGTLRGLAQPDVAVDSRALRQFDSAALAVLLALRRQALAAGKSMSVNGLPARLGDLARLYGVVELLGVASGSSASDRASSLP